MGMGLNITAQDLHAGLGDPVAHHDAGEGQGDDPDEEGEHLSAMR